MNRRVSALFHRKKPRQDGEADTIGDNSFPAANGNSQYTNSQAPYSRNAAPYTQTTYPTVFASNEPPYRAVPPVPQPLQHNQEAPRTVLPYPPTPRQREAGPQYNLDTNNAYSRDRTPSNPSPAPSYGSNPTIGSNSEYSIISVPQNPSPRQPNLNPHDAFRISPPLGSGPHFGRPNELPANAAVPHLLPGNQRSYQDMRPQHGQSNYADGRHMNGQGIFHNGQATRPRAAFPDERQPVPFRPPPAAAPLAPPAAPPPAPAPLQQRPPQQYPIEDIPAANSPAESEKLRIQRKHNTSKTYIRQLRQLIREKYRLDVWIWQHRNVLPANRRLVKAKCDMADAAMQEIYQIINHWDESLFEPDEWKVAKRIKDGINKHADKYQSWDQLPPWERIEDEEADDIL